MECSHVFSCQMCGECCEGQGGIVVSPTDLERLTKYLKLTSAEFIELYAEYVGTKLKLRQKNGACIFFEKRQGCVVHDSKPSICKAWPFFKGNLIDPLSLELAKDFCPGINRSVSFQEFAKVGYFYLETEHLIASNAATEANALIL